MDARARRIRIQDLHTKFQKLKTAQRELSHIPKQLAGYSLKDLEDETELKTLIADLSSSGSNGFVAQDTLNAKYKTYKETKTVQTQKEDVRRIWEELTSLSFKDITDAISTMQLRLPPIPEEEITESKKAGEKPKDEQPLSAAPEKLLDTLTLDNAKALAEKAKAWTKVWSEKATEAFNEFTKKQPPQLTFPEAQQAPVAPQESKQEVPDVSPKVDEAEIELLVDIEKQLPEIEKKITTSKNQIEKKLSEFQAGWAQIVVAKANLIVPFGFARRDFDNLEEIILEIEEKIKNVEKETEIKDPDLNEQTIAESQRKLNTIVEGIQREIEAAKNKQETFIKDYGVTESSNRLESKILGLKTNLNAVNEKISDDLKEKMRVQKEKREQEEARRKEKEREDAARLQREKELQEEGARLQREEEREAAARLEQKKQQEEREREANEIRQNHPTLVRYRSATDLYKNHLEKEIKKIFPKEADDLLKLFADMKREKKEERKETLKNKKNPRELRQALKKYRIICRVNNALKTSDDPQTQVNNVHAILREGNNEKTIRKHRESRARRAIRRASLVAGYGTLFFAPLTCFISKTKGDDFMEEINERRSNDLVPTIPDPAAKNRSPRLGWS